MNIKTETKVGFFIILSLIIFLFMIIKINALRLNTTGYSKYKVSFNDASGLSKKAEVKIAGVKVGYIENIILDTKKDAAVATIMIKKQFKLYKNSTAIIKQDGLLGLKYLEIAIGDPNLQQLNSGDFLLKPLKNPVSVDELLSKFSNIANYVEDITKGLKQSLAGEEQIQHLKNIIINFATASEKFNSLSTSLDSVFSNNQDALNKIILNLESFSENIKNDIPELKKELLVLTKSLQNDFSKITKNLGVATNSIYEAADQAKEGFQSLSSVTDKIDKGNGLIGKLINEDELYLDIKSTVIGMKNYLSKFESLGVIIDTHSENMYRPVDNFQYADSKGYFNIRVHTNESFFYCAQLAVSEKGFVQRKYIYNDYYNAQNQLLNYSELTSLTTSTLPTTPNSNATINTANQFAFAPKIVTRTRDNLAFGFQFGKIYKDLALRMGLFEGTFGIGADLFIPFKNNKLAYVTTLEAFDFNGTQRFERIEARPHLKWLNRIFFLTNCYFTFGADDFISSNNASTFWGLGIRFGDDDIKYLLSKVGLYIAM